MMQHSQSVSQSVVLQLNKAPGPLAVVTNYYYKETSLFALFVMFPKDRLAAISLDDGSNHK